MVEVVCVFVSPVPCLCLCIGSVCAACGAVWLVGEAWFKLNHDSVEVVVEVPQPGAQTNSKTNFPTQSQQPIITSNHALQCEGDYTCR